MARLEGGLFGFVISCGWCVGWLALVPVSIGLGGCDAVSWTLGWWMVR